MVWGSLLGGMAVSLPRGLLKDDTGMSRGIGESHRKNLQVIESSPSGWL